MIEGVVFDFGGVMTTSPLPLRLKAVTDGLGIDWRIFVDGFARHRLGYDQGVITIREMYDRILCEAGVRLDAEARERIERADTESWLYRNEETLGLMERLKAKGLKLGILTNMSPLFAPLFKRHFADFIALSDALVISGEEQLVKPMPEIYRLLETRIALKPGALCFVDDLEKNCEAARVCGWRAVRFESVPQVEAELEARLAEVG